VPGDRNIEAAKNGYAAFAAGDLETTLSYFDDDVEYVVAGDSAVGGTYRGKAELLGMFAKMAEHPGTVTPSRFVADGDGDVVVVVTDVTAGGEPGAEVDIHTFRNGKIIKTQNFGDTALNERVFGTK
jgi:uncharacterized protein